MTDLSFPQYWLGSRDDLKPAIAPKAPRRVRRPECYDDRNAAAELLQQAYGRPRGSRQRRPATASTTCAAALPSP
ncbi:hypothetical protein tb265_25880 [Gemmatimonadetes bacterium T265]|nr:hypothetical protein tb265_25880 [Gemmatimonadetes bacterium T265]